MDSNVSSAAAAALDNAMSAPEPAPVAEPQAAEVSNTPVQPAPQVEQGTPAQDSQLDIDLSGVDPALAEQIRKGYMRQSDYTRKTQEVAQLRQFMEQTGGDVGSLQQAWELTSQLANNPVEVFNRLQTALNERGLLQAAPAESQAPEEYEETEWDVPPHIQQELDANRAFREQFERQQAMAAIEATYTNQVNQIRELHPDYAQQDLDRVTAFAFATGGNMIAANELYGQMKDEIVGEYLKGMAAVPDSVTVPASQGHAETPRAVASIKEAGEIAREQLRAQGFLT